jgi:hypothetical protein|eukprot:820599_1
MFSSEAVLQMECVASNDNEFNRVDVVIPKNGGGKERNHTEGFLRYTQLVNEVCDEYEMIPPRKKRQFVIDNVIVPLLNEKRNFYRYDLKKKTHLRVDVNDRTKLNHFASIVVMQKIRDIIKPSSKEVTEKKQNPTVESYPKGFQKSSDDNISNSKECSRSVIITTINHEEPEKEISDSEYLNLLFLSDDDGSTTSSGEEMSCVHPSVVVAYPSPLDEFHHKLEGIDCDLSQSEEHSLMDQSDLMQETEYECDRPIISSIEISNPVQIAM